MADVMMWTPPEPEPAQLPWDPATGERLDRDTEYRRWAAAYLPDALRRGDEITPPTGPRRTWTDAERARWPEPAPPAPASKPKRPKPRVGRIDVPDRHRRERDAAPPEPTRPTDAAPIVTPTRGEALARRLRTAGVTSARWEQTGAGRWGLYVDDHQERAAQRIIRQEASR